MASPTLLLVQHALPPAIQAIPHVAQHVSEFLLPTTIDAAVYNDLQRVLKAFEGFRPYTTGAMDGAAANGRLDILRRLHSERGEGCSSSAFIGAASNGHVEVLKWLYKFYRQLRQELQELTEATKHGHLDTVQFLLRFTRLERLDREQMLVTAAANGHVAVVRVFLGGILSANGALEAAAANGHVAVVQLLLNTCYPYAKKALEKAIEGGHIDTIKVLVKAVGELGIRETAAVIGADTMRLILERIPLTDEVLATVLQIAAKNNKCDVVRVLLEKMETTGLNVARRGSRFTNPIHSEVASAMIDAVDTGRLDMLMILTKNSASYAGDTLRHAVKNDQWEVQKLLLEICEAKYLKEPRMAPSITRMLEQAAADDDLEILQQIFTKCGEVDVGDALRTVKNDSMQVVSLLAEKSESSSIAGALIDAATGGKAEMVQALLDHADHQAIEKALRKTVKSGNAEISKMLISRLAPNSHERIFQNAALSGCVGVLRLLLGQMKSCSIHCALICAAAWGHTEVVAELLEKSDSSAISCALQFAAVEGRLPVAWTL
ncbi:hypothetical protein PR001_g22816 [Phytophthora rubi]|uniref:Uncharacterized protein n=1 Tax=Phytophthora rubi TaxID=129364 RepID=A0A6A3IU76_9STRA|nr:hypothetical protein PR001_g22816 [Phytophthora rubi]